MAVMTPHLPAEKLEKFCALLTDWHGCKSGLKGGLESLVGQLQHASKAVCSGRSLAVQLTGANQPHPEALSCQAECKMPGRYRVVGHLWLVQEWHVHPAPR